MLAVARWWQQQQQASATHRLSVFTAAAAPTHLVQPACADVQVLVVHSGVQLALWRLLFGLLAVCALVPELECLLVREQETRSGSHQTCTGRLADALGGLATHVRSDSVVRLVRLDAPLQNTVRVEQGRG